MNRNILTALLVLIFTPAVAETLPVCNRHPDNSSKDDIKYVKSFSNEYRLILMQKGMEEECPKFGRYNAPTHDEFARGHISQSCHLTPPVPPYGVYWIQEYMIDKSGRMYGRMDAENPELQAMNCWNPINFFVERSWLKK